MYAVRGILLVFTPTTILSVEIIMFILVADY